MSKGLTLTLALVLSTVIAGCEGPFVLLPGGALEGRVVEPPPSWSFTDEVDTIQLESGPSDPYSVNIWVIALDGHLYVHAGTNRARWIENMENDPTVRLRVDESIYELGAARVVEQAEFDRFADLYEAKYGRRPGNESVSEAYLFRLSPRS